MAKDKQAERTAQPAPAPFAGVTGRFSRIRRYPQNVAYWVAEVIDVVDGRVVALKTSEWNVHPSAEAEAMDGARYTQDVIDGNIREDARD